MSHDHRDRHQAKLMYAQGPGPAGGGEHAMPSLDTTALACHQEQSLALTTCNFFRLHQTPETAFALPSATAPMCLLCCPLIPKHLNCISKRAQSKTNQ